MKKVLSFVIGAVMVMSLLASVAPASAAYTLPDKADIERVVKSMGIMKGDEKGNMNLPRNVTRAQFATLLVMASPLKDGVGSGSGSSPFKDVKSAHWASGYIKAAADAGWVIGYLDGTFRPDNIVLLEEAASAILKLLGYGPSDYAGSYPNAQISKFTALGLVTGLSVRQGSALTRGDCMVIFYNLLSAKQKDGKTYGAQFGYPIDSDGYFDYKAYVDDLMEGPFILSADSLAPLLPFSADKAKVYRNGEITAISSASRYDVYYYSEVSGEVWIYDDRAEGAITDIKPNRTSPASITVGGAVCELGTDEAKRKISAAGGISLGDTVVALLGMNGEVVDLYKTGPYVLTANSLYSIASALPFDLEGAAVYRNNKAASISSARKYDVYYYNVTTKEIWICSNPVAGLLTAVSPNRTAPASVTVGGNSYSLGTSEAKRKVSNTGGFVIGDTVALLLGMDGEVVDIVEAALVDATYYGMVLSVEPVTYSIGINKSAVEYLATIVCTDGITRQCVVPGNYYSTGTLVSFGYTGGKLEIKRLPSRSLSGTVNVSADKLGDYSFAEDIEIMEVSGTGEWTTLPPSRLSRAEITGGVQFYLLNNKGEIVVLILKDVTGDMYDYGVITSVSEVVTEIKPATPEGWTTYSYNGSYSYIIDGKPGNYATSHFLGIKTGAGRFISGSNGISSIKNLTGVSLTDVSSTQMTAVGGYTRLGISGKVQVYLRESGGAYHLTELSAVSDLTEYSLTGYYENDFAAGGLIRVIVAGKRVSD